MADLEDRTAIAALLRQSAQETLRVLTTSTGWGLLQRDENEFHPGDDPIEADEEAQRAFASVWERAPASSKLRVRAVRGEENLEDLPNDLIPGDRIVVVDPLDGSKPWALFRQGYCVAAEVLRLIDRVGNDHRYELSGAIVATPVDAFTLLGDDELRVGRTFDTSDSDILVTSVLPESDVMPTVFSAVAYKRDRYHDGEQDAWAKVMRLTEALPSWGAVTLGGNPMFPYVVVGGLTAALTFKASTTWDTLGILMATATDAVVGRLDGQLVSGPAFRQLFAQVLLSSENVYPIPAMIVAKSEARYREIVEGASQAGIGAIGLSNVG